MKSSHGNSLEQTTDADVPQSCREQGSFASDPDDQSPVAKSNPDHTESSILRADLPILAHPVYSRLRPKPKESSMNRSTPIVLALNLHAVSMLLGCAHPDRTSEQSITQSQQVIFLSDRDGDYEIYLKDLKSNTITKLTDNDDTEFGLS